MYVWVLLILICLGSAIFGGIPGIPIDMRIPALLFGGIHIISEKFKIWDDECLWVTLAMIVTVLDFFMEFDLTANIGFWVMSFHILQHGGFRSTA